ncbi:MAG: membrane protein insertion efficiency factor YidD [Spirochaetota bacterium]|nr:membrane protein insertion efficiency factor YidD [Spirochaetota bacterium]
MRWLAVSFIRIYQKVISPMFPPSCRFYPSCSEYSRQAFIKYPFLKAIYLSVSRLFKCHPYHPGGYDPLK